MADATSYHLERFVEAQRGWIEQVFGELRQGQKQSHWMWFIFPQLKGLGKSEMAIRYAIDSLEEAFAYIEHPILGQRLRQCTDLVLHVQGGSVEQIFGCPDNLKFRSSMTLFASATPDNDTKIFRDALDKYFSGVPDKLTIELLRRQRS